MRQLLSVYGRRPRVVMKASLQFDPSLDVMANRLPNVFVSHRQAGGRIFTDQIDRLASVADIWRSLPMDQVVHAKWWRVPVGEVPRHADYESQVQWLYDWWQRIDAWITDNRPAGVVAAQG